MDSAPLPPYIPLDLPEGIAAESFPKVLSVIAISGIKFVQLKYIIYIMYYSTKIHCIHYVLLCIIICVLPQAALVADAIHFFRHIFTQAEDDINYNAGQITTGANYDISKHN